MGAHNTYAHGGLARDTRQADDEFDIWQVLQEFREREHSALEQLEIFGRGRV